MRFLLLIFSLVLISTDVTSNPLERIKDIFSQSGNEVITDIKINSSVDVWGDEVKTETKKIYFLIDVEGVEEEGEVRVDCEDEKAFESTFPFYVYLKFKKDLDFSRKRLPEVLVKYKLGNGDKGEYTYTQISPSSYGVEKYRHFHTATQHTYLVGFSPTNAMFQRLRKDPSLNNGEIKLVFPTRSGSNILVSFNPFHESWIDLYINECRGEDWSDRNEVAIKLEKIMGWGIDTSKAEAMFPDDEF